MPKGQLLKSKEFAHVAIVFFLTSFGTEIEAKLIDHFDTVILEPIVPTVRANGRLDALAKIVAHWRGSELPRKTAGHTTRTLTAETVTGRGLSLLGLRDRLA